MASQNADIEKIGGWPDLSIVKTSNDLKAVAAEDADMALQVYNNTECTEAEVAGVDENKLLRKIDFHLMPIVSLPFQPSYALAQEALRCLLPSLYSLWISLRCHTPRSWASRKITI